MQATARIFVQMAPAKKTKDDLYPVKLCITYKSNRKYYSITDRIKTRDWIYLPEAKNEKGEADIEGAMKKRVAMIKKADGSVNIKFTDINNEYKRIIREVEDIINEITNEGKKQFSFNQFEERYLNKPGSWDNVYSAMWLHIQDLKNENRFGYASSLESTLKAVKEFHSGKKFEFHPRSNDQDKVAQRAERYLSGKPLHFVDITPTWLKRFEKELRDQGKSKSTIGIYARNIRTVFNLALKHKIKAEYPFKEYKPKSSSRRKIALSAHQINLIENYHTEDPREIFARDLFLFSFYGCGMNLSDIARLKFSNIQGDEIIFVREKTKNENGEEKILSIPITKSMQNIINRHGNKAVGHDAYIFPILRPEWSESHKYAVIKQLTKQTNKYIRKIADALDITEHISTYSARHSWATLSKYLGANIELIMEGLGHGDLKTTQIYLKAFPQEVRKEHAKKLENEIEKAI